MKLWEVELDVGGALDGKAIQEALLKLKAERRVAANTVTIQVDELQHLLERDLSPIEVAKIQLLTSAGVTVHDWTSAIDAWGRAYRVSDDFGYISSVALTKAADRHAALTAAPVGDPD